jgi:hypothetical protein
VISAHSVPMVAYTTLEYVLPFLRSNYSSREERCSLRGACRDFISKANEGASSHSPVEWEWVTSSSQIPQVKERPHFKTHKNLKRTNIRSRALTKPETKNDCAGEDPQQNTGLD